MSLILCLVPMTPCETMLYWSHISALVAYNAGSSPGHGPVRTPFLEPDFASRVGTLDVGHGPFRTLFLSLPLCLFPMTHGETMLYWSHISALVAYNGGTSVGHDPVRTLFLEPDFVSSVGTLDVSHGPVRTLFLSLVLCLVPMTHYEAMLYWSHISALVAYNAGSSFGHGPVTTFFLEPDFASRVGKLDADHGPVRTLFLSLVLCLVRMTPLETMLYLPHITAFVAYNRGTSVGHSPVRTLFQRLILFPVLAHWIVAMALSEIFPRAWLCVSSP